MKRAIQKKVFQTLAAASKKMAEANANSACILWMHQPKLPEVVKKLRKFLGCIIIAMLLVRFDCLGFLFCGILSTFCGIVIFLLAPVEDHNKPLEDVEIIHYRVRTQIVLVVEGMLLIVFESLDWRTGTVSITLAFSTMCLLLLIGKAKNILRKERFYENQI